MMRFLLIDVSHRLLDARHRDTECSITGLPGEITVNGKRHFNKSWSVTVPRALN